ncbi:unnamed protein product, partial [Pylaiella littoralis]
ISDLKARFGDEAVEKSFRVWQILISKILYEPILRLILACESPQRGWKIFLEFY